MRRVGDNNKRCDDRFRHCTVNQSVSRDSYRLMTKHFLADVAFDATIDVPTQSPGDNSTKAASTAYVDTAVAGVSGGGASEWNAGTVAALAPGLLLTSDTLAVDPDVVPYWADIGGSISDVSTAADTAKALATRVQILTTPSVRQTGLIIPYYTEVEFPLADSTFASLFELVRHHPTVPVIVVVKQTGSDAAGGPGPTTPAMEEQIKLLAAAGATIAGYVPTGSGARDSTAVNADIDLWHNLYPDVEAIFLDQVPTDGGESDVNYSTYIGYYQYAHDHAYKLVIANWGTPATAAWYTAGVADIFCIYDSDSWPSPITFDIDPYPYSSGAITDFPVRKFAALIKNTTFDQNTFDALRPYFRWIYCTDGTGDTPYAGLSSDLEVEFRACAAQDQSWRFGTVTGIGDNLTLSDGILDVAVGSLTFTDLHTSQSVQVGANDAAYAFFIANGTAGSHRYLQFSTAGNARWVLGCSDAAESGSDVGSDFYVNAYHDDGSSASQPLTINRANGVVTMGQGAAISGGSSTIDGAVIGGTSPAAASVTTMTASYWAQIGLNGGTGYIFANVNGAAGSTRYFQFQTDGSNRWGIGCDNSAESGGNVGSDMFINRFADDGSWLSQPLFIARATGRATFAHDIQIGGGSGPTWTSGSGAPSSTQPNGSLYSRSDGSTGSRLYVSAGGGVWSAVSGV
jgi:hypothetical protein